MFYHRSSAIADDNSFFITIIDDSGVWLRKKIIAGYIQYYHLHNEKFSTFEVLYGPTFDFSAVRYIRFTPDKHTSDTVEFVDIISVLPQSDPGKLRLSIIDFTSSNEPLEDSTIPNPLILDTNETYRDANLNHHETMALYNVLYGHAHYTDYGMTVGNYYGLLFENISETKNIDIMGIKEQAYLDGKLRTCYNDGVWKLGSDTTSSMRFNIISHPRGYVDRMIVEFNDSPGEESLLWFEYYDAVNKKIMNVPIIMYLKEDQTKIEFDCPSRRIYIDRKIGMYGYFQKNDNTLATKITITTFGRRQDL